MDTSTTDTGRGDTPMDLGSSDVRPPDLAGADLGSGDLRSDLANLDRGPDLGIADLGIADLGTADLRTADLGTADLRAADLGNTDVARLDGMAEVGNLDAPDAFNLDAPNLDVGPDTIGPTVISTNPIPGGMNVSLKKIVTATFSELMNGATINDVTFTLRQGLNPNPIAGTVSYVGVGSTATFLPMNDLVVNMTYTAMITTGVTDVAGNAMAVDYTWTFSTAVCGQGTVVLGAAAGFAVLAGSTVTNTGPTVVTGDLGVSPLSAITGFGAAEGTVIGTQHPADPTSAQAQLSLTTAYDDAKGRTLCPVAVSGNLGGLTLTPGLYKSTDSLEISAGNLTLDAEGDPNAVFIFQMASTLMATSGRQVFLIGMAKSANVFWQVGTSATFGTTSAFQGTIMADQAIAFMTGATLNGRALARSAAVTMQSNAITISTP
jgi:hypothetical protein